MKKTKFSAVILLLVFMLTLSACSFQEVKQIIENKENPLPYIQSEAEKFIFWLKEALDDTWLFWGDDQLVVTATNKWEQHKNLLEVATVYEMKLSSENLVGQSSLSVAYDLCMRDGSLICTVKSGSQVLGQYSGNVGVSVPVGMSNISMPKAAQAVIGAAAAIATKNPAGVGMAALDFGDVVTPNYSCIGGLDGMASVAADQNITCYTVFHDTIVAPNTALAAVGSPTNAPKSLAGLTGFVQCLDAHVEAPAMGEELAEIDSFLNSGIFIE